MKQLWMGLQMADKIDGKECRYWFKPTPGDYRKCALRGEDDNCDEINDCFIKELLGKLAQKDEECNRLKEEIHCLTKLIKKSSVSTQDT